MVSCIGVGHKESTSGYRLDMHFHTTSQRAAPHGTHCWKQSRASLCFGPIFFSGSAVQNCLWFWACLGSNVIRVFMRIALTNHCTARAWEKMDSGWRRMAPPAPTHSQVEVDPGVFLGHWAVAQVVMTGRRKSNQQHW